MMRMPRFTAEDSLQKASGYYRSTGASVSAASGTTVGPQMLFCDFNAGGDLICGDAPFGGPIDFGGGSISDTVRCNKCRIGCLNSKTRIASACDEWCSDSPNKKSCKNACINTKSVREMACRDVCC